MKGGFMTILLLLKKIFVTIAFMIAFLSIGIVSDDQYQNAVITPGDQMIIDFFKK